MVKPGVVGSTSRMLIAASAGLRCGAVLPVTGEAPGGVGVGNCESPPNLPSGHAGQVALLLLRGAELLEQVGVDDVRVDHAAEAHPATRQLLDDGRVRDE